MNAPNKKPSSVALAKAYRRLADHPVGGLLVEDLAASREHGLVTARVGIAPDGNPIVYARDEAVAKRIGEAMQNQTAVHVRPIPPLDVREFKLLSRQAERALGAPALTAGDASVAPSTDGEPTEGVSLDDYRSAVEAALVGACGVATRQDAHALTERFAVGVEKGHREGATPESVAHAIVRRAAV